MNLCTFIVHETISEVIIVDCIRTYRETSPTSFTFHVPKIVTFSSALSLSTLRHWEKQLAVVEWLSNVFLLGSLSAVLWSVSHSSTFALVSSTGVFLQTSLFRWASEHSLCVFQSPRIPAWTLSGFRLCAALPVSIKRSVGAWVWHSHRTWWETVETNTTITKCFLYYCNTPCRLFIIFTLSFFPLVLHISQCWTFFSFTFIAFLSIRRLAHSLKPQSNECCVSAFCHVKEIWKLFGQILTKWSLDDLCYYFFVPLFLLGENEFNDLQGLTGLDRCSRELLWFRASFPAVHCFTSSWPGSGCRMERWQNKKPNRHVSSPHPPRPARALT